MGLPSEWDREDSWPREDVVMRRAQTGVTDIGRFSRRLGCDGLEGGGQGRIMVDWKCQEEKGTASL